MAWGMGMAWPKPFTEVSMNMQAGDWGECLGLCHTHPLEFEFRTA